MRRWAWVVGLLALVSIAIGLYPTAPVQSPETFSLQGLLGPGADDGSFRQASQDYRIRFPEDHRRHPDYRNEWWYLTGQLRDKHNPKRRFGVQLTLFRFALAPPAQLNSANPWIDPQFYMGHFAITDIASGKHYTAERFSRRGPGLAGAEGVPIRLWLADWQMQSRSPEGLFPMRLQARDGDRSLALELAALKPPLLQGAQGYSRKNNAGGASHYYSYTRLQGEGRIELNGRRFEVEGLAWFDHEWSSNSLTPAQQGWDWFSLQLDDERELMFYRFRNRDGSEGLRQVALVDSNGQRLDVDPGTVVLQPQGRWRSPTGRSYPASWHLAIPQQGLALQIEPLVADQEMRLSVTYWEGAVRVTGSHNGHGYVELAGY